MRTETDDSAVPLCLAQKIPVPAHAPVTEEAVLPYTVVNRLGQPLGGESVTPVPPCHTNPRLSLRTWREHSPSSRFIANTVYIIVRNLEIVKWICKKSSKNLTAAIAGKSITVSALFSVWALEHAKLPSVLRVCYPPVPYG